MRQRSKQTLSISLVIIALLCLLAGSVIGGMVGFALANSWGATTATASGALAQNALASAPANLAAPAAANQTATTVAVQQTLPAVVTIIAQGGFMGQGSGSGFFISADGYLITNNHVIENAQNISVIYAKGGQSPARLIGAAPEFDLAVLKVDGPVPGYLTWGDSTAQPLGAPVIAIGSALGEYRNSVTAGILSGFNRQVGPMGSLLQTDAAINQGNSGGPLINYGGEVIGVNTLVVRGDFADAEGLGFAIPSNIARSVATNLIETGDARHPFLGIQYEALNPQLASQAGLDVTEGALIQAVLDGTPAAAAGLRAGDVIVALNNRPVDDRNSLVSLLLEHVAGETVTLDVLRGGQAIQTQLTLGERA